MITLLVQRRPLAGDLLNLQPVLPDPEAPAYQGRCLSYHDTAPGIGEARLLIDGVERQYAVWLPCAPLKGAA